MFIVIHTQIYLEKQKNSIITVSIRNNGHLAFQVIFGLEMLAPAVTVGISSNYINFIVIFKKNLINHIEKNVLTSLQP